MMSKLIDRDVNRNFDMKHGICYFKWTFWYIFLNFMLYVLQGCKKNLMFEEMDVGQLDYFIHKLKRRSLRKKSVSRKKSQVYKAICSTENETLLFPQSVESELCHQIAVFLAESRCIQSNWSGQMRFYVDSMEVLKCYLLISPVWRWCINVILFAIKWTSRLRICGPANGTWYQFFYGSTRNTLFCNAEWVEPNCTVS